LDVKKVWKEDGKIKYEMFGSIYSIDPSEVKKVVKESEKKKLDKAQDIKYLISLKNGKFIITDSYDEEDEKIVYYKGGLTIKVPKKAIKEIKEVTDDEIAAIDQFELDNNKQKENTEDSLNRIASQSRYRAMRESGREKRYGGSVVFIKEGMSVSQVLSVAGVPDSKKTRGGRLGWNNSGPRYDEEWQYYDCGGRVWFKDGIVIKVQAGCG